MQKYYLLILFLICTTYSYSTINFSSRASKADYLFITLTETDISINLEKYVLLKPADFKELVGHKLTWRELIVFKIAKKQIKKTIRKDGTVDMIAFQKKLKEPFKWHWGGFILGLLLPVLGLLITAFFKDEQRKNRINCAAIGTCVISLALVLIFLISVSK